MSEKIDHTAAIFTALNITPTAHPWAYKVNNDGEIWSLEKFLLWYSIDDADYYPYELLSGTLEADGLAVSLVEIAIDKGIKISSPIRMTVWDKAGLKSSNQWRVYIAKGRVSKMFYSDTQAHTVHDALCEVLGITEEEKV